MNKLKALFHPLVSENRKLKVQAHPDKHSGFCCFYSVITIPSAQEKENLESSLNEIGSFTLPGHKYSGTTS